MSGQGGFDFAQFDAHATDFNLVVVAPQVFKVTLRQPAREIAGAVHAAFDKRVVEEAFGTELGAVEVAPCDTFAADVQLPRYTDGHRALLFIQQIHCRIGDGRADVQRLAHFHGTGGGDHRGFGGAVVVDHRKGLRLGKRPQAVAADQQGAQGRMLQALAESVLGHGRRQEAYLQRLRSPPTEQRVDIFGAVMSRRQVHGGAHAQRRPDFPGHRVKPEAGDTGGVAAGAQVKGLAMPVHQVRDGVMLDHHALGQAGGA